jgi:MFS transporter, DHA2 family, methylenomycin A resistance protein
VIQLDVSVVNVAIKPIGVSLGGGVGALQWVVNAYTVAFAALILTAGALGDRVGAKRVFVGGFVLFTAASALCGLAPGLPTLIAARALQGVGAAVLGPCSLTLINHAYPRSRDRARALGLWAAGASVGLSAGPLIGGILTATLGWRAIFFINAPIEAAGIYLTLRWASETPRSAHRRVDVPGQVAGVVALAALAAATIEGGARGFGATLVLAGYGVAAASAAAFVAIEARRAHPMLPLRLFRSPTFSAATAVGLLVNVAFYGLIFVLSLYFQRQQQLNALQTGLAFAPMTAAVTAANISSGRLARGLPPAGIIACGAALMAAAYAGLLGIQAGTSYPELAGQLAACGFGIGLLVPAMTSALLGSADPSRSGVASGTLNSARQTGSVIGVALFGSLIAGHLVAGLHVALAIAAALCTAAALSALAVRRDTSAAHELQPLNRPQPLARPPSHLSDPSHSPDPPNTHPRPCHSPNGAETLHSVMIRVGTVGLIGGERMRNRRARMGVAVICLAIVALLSAACGTASGAAVRTASGSQKPSGTVVVFAAASLKDAFDTIGKQFEQANPGVTVKFNYAGSSSLATQIKQAAPADVFASADTTNMDTVTNDNLASDPQVFAQHPGDHGRRG